MSTLQSEGAWCFLLLLTDEVLVY